MSKFKAGDLALVINATIQSNLMKTVELIKFVKEDEELDSESVAWTDGWLALGDIVTTTGDKGVGVFPESWLMPLRGDFTPETERETELTQ